MGRPLPDGLGAALDDTLVEPALEELVREQLGILARVRGVKGEILKRRTLRYTLDLEGAPSARLHLIGKVYESRSAGERGLAALRWLSEQGFAARPPTHITVPRALGFLPELSLLLMEEAGGRSLQRLLKSEQARAEHMQLFAQALVKLHGFPAFGAPFTLDDHLEQRCAGLCASLAGAFPELAAPMARVVETARLAEREELVASYTLAHGDYHPGQVHLDGERLWLVDLDPLNRGDPAYDVAMVVVVLKRLEAQRADARYTAPLRGAFLAGYFSRMDLHIAERVPLNAALIFLKRACKRFRWRDEAGWEDAVRQEIEKAEQCLAWRKAVRPLHERSAVLELCERCPG